MIGRNELSLNQATMVEALQEWITKRMAGFAPQVVSVTFCRNGLSENFVVTVDRDAEGKSDGRT
jgi:hypothetical protein